MLVIKLLIIVALLLIFIQDLKYRAVYWHLFPLLTILFIVYHLIQHHPVESFGLSALVNNGFLWLQLLLVSVYFSIKNRRWINITDGLIGWGDVLLLASLAFYLSALNFLLFYVVSLVFVLIVWLAWKLVDRHIQQIPLAGLQAILLALILSGSWIYPAIDLTNDFWLTRFINP